MPDHTIRLVNHSGQKHKYAIVPAPPMMTLGDANGKHDGGVLAWHAAEVENQGQWDTTTTYQLYGWVGTTSQAPDFGVQTTTVDTKVAPPGTATTPASTFGLSVSNGKPTLTAKTNSAPMDTVRFDFDKDLSSSTSPYYLYGMAKGSRKSPDEPEVATPFAFFPPRATDSSVKYTVMAPVIQMWLCQYDCNAGQIVDFNEAIKKAILIRFLSQYGALLAKIKHKSDGSFGISYSE
ncbi:hypothetical protein BO94DRAFT_611243 [Aspergillus sclerotioniger CBS 115572]|uniref:Uncharacterized protein n=1 Tax=Aspergillus sclerotioniger CBS 115572 TaxID=1450535 RepID=A0A317V4D9_9EURO|nr:hypothetical protein BO94DRAFT_611243 [Aspergillus sclerotioniger CBS 115572]PWY68965.1 hypothetical protein BO94DRAFT_611243 [Aspergillus sclerotioniger CBS 115572]